MHWLDVCGPPGSGKSTVCDPMWGPHELPIEHELPPQSWHDFTNEVTRLMIMMSQHPTYQAVVRMNNRSFRKISTVARKESDKVYVQTALAQRGLGFGWRMAHMGIDMEELSHFFRLMPVSIGVVFIECSEEENIRRNKEREKVKETAHENRSFMVPLMKPAIEVAKRVLHERNVPVWTLSTESDPDYGQRYLRFLAGKTPHNPKAGGYSDQAPLLSAPYWWGR